METRGVSLVSGLVQSSSLNSGMRWTLLVEDERVDVDELSLSDAATVCSWLTELLGDRLHEDDVTLALQGQILEILRVLHRECLIKGDRSHCSDSNSIGRRPQIAKDHCEVNWDDFRCD